MAGKNAVVANHVVVGWRNEGRNFLKKLEGMADEMGGTVRGSFLQAVRDASVLQTGESA